MRDKNEVGKTIFVSYAHKDYHLYKELDKHFSELKTQKLIKVWHDREIHAGTEWEREINMYLDMADIVLLLISPDFISSQYCYGVEMKRALERHECGEAHVIPIIIRPVHWRGAPFSHLQVLPTKAQPVTTWDNRDEAFLDVVEGILKIVNGEPLSGDAQTNDAQGSKPGSLTNLYPQTLDASLSSLPFWLIFVRWFTARAEDRCYRQHLVYEHRVSDIKGLSTHTALGLELEQVFVNLHVNLMPADQVSDHPLHRPESPQETHSIWYYLSNHTFTPYNLVVLGAPGSGKTTLLKHLTLALAQLKKRTRRQRVRHTLPILLFLRDHARAIVDQPNFSLAQAVQNHMQQKWQTFWPMNWVSHHLEQGHCLILLDGLDEVADSETRQAVVAWVQKQFLAHSGNRFVLTSRPHGYRDNPLNGVAVLDIQKFTSGQVEQFVKKRYLVNEILRSGKNDSGARSRARRGAEDLMRSLRQAPAIHALAVNPLLLTIILIVHRPDRPLPEKRVELYAKLCEILLDRRQEANGIAQGLTPAEKRQVLQPLAYFLMQQGTREIDRKEAEAVIAPVLALVSPGIQPADFLPPTENISGLFLDRGSGGYGFMHQTFQEYLAATHIKEEGLEQTLVAQVTNGWWHETIRLYCAQADATEVIRSCLAVSPITVEALTLALECEKENLRLLPQVQVQLDSLQEINLEEVEQEQRRVLAEVRLTQRLHGMIHLQKETYIDTSLVTCAEYQLFLDEKYLEGHYHQPDHWTRFSFPKGSSNAPVLGVRRSDAQAFCEWLTARDREGWRYCLPRTQKRTIKEQEQQEDLHTEMGYWTSDSPHFVWIQGKPSVASQERMRDLKKSFDQTLASDVLSLSTSDILREYPRSLRDMALREHSLHYLRDRAFTNIFANTFDLTRTFDLDRAFGLFCELDFFRNFDREWWIDRSFAAELDCAFGLDRALDLICDLDRFRDFDHPYIPDCALVLALALALYLTASRSEMRIMGSAIGDSLPSSPLDLVPLQARDGAIDLYVMLFLLQERIAGNLSAYEGILLVKEPK